MSDRLSVLKTLGFDVKSSQSGVLKAIMMSQEELGSGVTFEMIEEKLCELSGGKKMSRPLIYRYLKALEESEAMIVNREVSPNLYVVNFESVLQAIQRSKLSSISEIDRELREIDYHEDALTDLDLSWLARRLYVILAGKPERVGTKTVKGLSDAHNLIDTEIYSRAVEGDTIRITLDWFQLSERTEIERQAVGLKLAVKGINIRSLLYFPERVPKENIRMRYERLKDLREKGINSEMRVATRKVRTYQGVALNRDGLALVVSEEPLTMVWIPHSSNSALIDEAINSYDRDFQSGIDFLEYYREEFDES